MNKIVRVVICILCFCAAVEASARFDDMMRYGADFLKPYLRETTINDSDEFGTTGKPNSRFEKWGLNNLGFRGPDVDIRKGKETVRIICAGASSTFGLYEDEGMEWPIQLRDMLQGLQIKTEVINASFPGIGYTYPKIIQRFTESWIKLDPDFFIIYADFLRYMYDVPEVKAEKKYKDKGQRRTSLFSNMRSLQKAKLRWRQHAPKILLEVRDKHKLHKVIEQNKKRDKRTLLRPEDAERRIDEELTSLSAFCAERDVILIIASFVKKLDEIDLLHLRGSNTKLSEQEIVELHFRLNDYAKKVAAQKGIVFVDNAALIGADETNLADPHHFTNEGARKMADNFYQAIYEQLQHQSN